MKIVLTDCKTVTNGDLDLTVLERFGTVAYYPLTSAQELPGRIADAQAIICNKTLLNAAALSNAPQLRYIGLFATGYNNIDLSYTNAHGITVCNAGSYSTNAVAQHTFALLLHHYSRVAQYNEFTARGNWMNSETFSPFVFPTAELAGKTIGIIGYGSIGRQVALIARAFGMKGLVYTRTPREKEQNICFTDLETLVLHSDVVTVHCPLNELSKGMFNRELFRKMKKDAYFINTARGAIAEEDALAQALNEGWIAGAAIDVLETEPMRKDCPLFGAKNITVTPHIAWAPLETRKRLLQIVADNLAAYLSGSPTNVVS